MVTLEPSVFEAKGSESRVLQKKGHLVAVQLYESHIISTMTPS